MPTQKLSPAILTAAIEGFEQQKARIDGQIAELRAMLTGGSTGPVATPYAPMAKRGPMTAAARKRIADAQRRRWAESKGKSPASAVTSAPVKPKRVLSAAGKAAIVAALKKRWAAKKAAARAVQPAVKKVAVKKIPAKKALKKAAPAKKAVGKKTVSPPALPAAE